jgi:hypothetical protein
VLFSLSTLNANFLCIRYANRTVDIETEKDMEILNSTHNRVPWFLTRIESMGVDGCEKQWYRRDTRVYIASSLWEDKNPTSCVSRYIMIRWVETPSTSPFIG